MKIEIERHSSGYYLATISDGSRTVGSDGATPEEAFECLRLAATTKPYIDPDWEGLARGVGLI